jgi:hypothetical protein
MTLLERLGDSQDSLSAKPTTAQRQKKKRIRKARKVTKRQRGLYYPTDSKPEDFFKTPTLSRH